MKPEDLWVPDFASDFLLVTIDPTEAGDREWEDMQLVNGAAYKWVTGQMDGETYFDTLEYAGIDPIEFVAPVFEYLRDFR